MTSYYTTKLTTTLSVDGCLLQHTTFHNTL